MTTSTAADRRIAFGFDHEDGLPVWTFGPGEELVPGLLARHRLGVGTRCETWLAWSRSLWAPAVVKLARPHQLDHPRARRALQREVDALSGVLHPCLPRLYAADLDADRPHVVLEHVDGPALADLLRPWTFRGVTATVHLTQQLLSALLPLHAAGVAHLDLKPDNVVVRDGRAVVVDLGSARKIGSRQPAGRPVGTLGYAAPEMEACAPIAAAMDVYGVGMVAAEVRGACGSRLPGPRSRRLAGVLADLRAPEPGDRPGVAEALDALDELLPRRARP
ncbi:Protein kinase domain-containing protein [Friedmanniella luteola]|uniref:non-specific serine/threonine protein kinase n=1 Tax=Friedmanniella luteola TaxID=546871 RepID=A0A1H1TFC7_9ACTN|nr:protein kinase [Friedmanniella luteola]SDS58888.1 Protein kinase domain-containing protein [Friedmanniella luteola]